MRCATALIALVSYLSVVLAHPAINDGVIRRDEDVEARQIVTTPPWRAAEPSVEARQLTSNPWKLTTEEKREAQLASPSWKLAPEKRELQLVTPPWKKVEVVPRDVHGVQWAREPQISGVPWKKSAPVEESRKARGVQW